MTPLKQNSTGIDHLAIEGQEVLDVIEAWVDEAAVLIEEEIEVLVAEIIEAVLEGIEALLEEIEEAEAQEWEVVRDLMKEEEKDLTLVRLEEIEATAAMMVAEANIEVF